MGDRSHAIQRRGPAARVWAVLGAIALVATLLVVLQVPGSAHSVGSTCGANTNPVACENSKPGTSPDEWDINGAGDASIQGFATDISVNAGSKIDFKVDTDAAAYGITIYRTGWYQGLGARKIATVSPSATLPQHQPECISDASTELYDCGTWKVSASWTVPSDAVSGVYLALLHRNDTGGESQIVFVVRNDGNTSDVLFQTSDPTWQAYNTYGGSDFYQGNANGRSYKISYNRPVVTRGEMQGRDSYFSAEYATVRFLERNGHDVSYMAGVDTDRRGAELLKHNVFLSEGHDEYWSGAQRKNVEAARDAGVNLQFLSGNEVYWHTRYEDSADGSSTPYRTLTSYKETWGNSANPGGGKMDPSTTWTGTWRDPRYSTAADGGHLPENQLTGTIYMVNDVDLPITVSSAEGKTRLWRNTSLTSLAAGTAAPLAAHTIGYESDEDVDNGMRPAGLVRLSTTVGPTPQYLTDYGNVTVSGTTEHHVTLYRAPSGALVFGAGTVQWGWGLDQEHDGDGAPADPRMQQAEVNLLADMGAQPATLMSGLVAATKSSDTTAPSTTITSPTAGSSIANGTKVTVKGTAADSDGVVAGVEVSTDGGDTWHPATGTTSWSYSYVQQGVADAKVTARAIDDSGNYAKAGVSVSVKVTGASSLFGTAVPAASADSDGGATELGTRFTPKSDGFITGVRFYKAAGNTGTHTGSLWDDEGKLLASVTFTAESDTGWQQAEFTSPVQVIQGAHYTVSYSAPQGHYSYTERYWPYQARTTAPLVADTDGTDATTPGVYGSVGSMPTQRWIGTNYFVDALYTPSDTSPLRISSAAPLQGSSSNDPTTPVTVTFTRGVDTDTLSLKLTDSAGHAVTGTTKYTASTRTATFAPSVPLDPATTYTVNVAAKDTNGVGLADGAGKWTFATAEATRAAGDCPCTLFPELTHPDATATDGPASVTLGVRFSSAQAGKVTALRFYKGQGNTGTHTGTLWSSSGGELATVTFADESTQGWQTATLDTPVQITKDIEYVVSYTAPAGNYAVASGRFASSFTRGPLTVPANGAVYSYTGGFPEHASSTDYGVDLVLTTQAAGPSLASTSPLDGATGVAADTAISADFDATISTADVSVKANGDVVNGTTAVSGKRVTFTPSDQLPQGAAVSVKIDGIKGTNQVTGDAVTYSFTVARGDSSEGAVSFFSGAPAATTATDDPDSVVLGMTFTTSVAGQVDALRFYKAPTNTGTHKGWLYGPESDTPLASVTFSGESASGWQRAELATPVDLVPGVKYTVAYLAPHGNYSYQPGVFTAPLTSGPLTAVSPDNGVYVYGASGRPVHSAPNATSYLVDLEFLPQGGGSEPDPSSGSPSSPAPSSDPSSPGPTPSDTPTTSPTGTPTADPTPAGQTLFGTATPQVPATTDSEAVELGTAFTVAREGKVTALRFYKGAGNTGSHVGSLWDADGHRLATVAFKDESASGWQTAVLDTPVSVRVGTTYVASYLAPQGHYSYEGWYFADAVTHGDITGVATTNGRFHYGEDGGFPTSSGQAAAYFVDAVVSFDAGGSGDTPASPTGGAPQASSPAATPAEQERTTR